MDRLDDLKETIKKDKLLPDYIKELALDVLRKIDYFTISLAKSTIGHITLAYFREHQYESDADREIERLKKENEWWIEQYCKMNWPNGWICEEVSEKEYKMRAKRHMQQALKVEGEMKKKIKRLTITSFDMLQLKKWHKLRHKNKH